MVGDSMDRGAVDSMVVCRVELPAAHSCTRVLDTQNYSLVSDTMGC